MHCEKTLTRRRFTFFLLVVTTASCMAALLVFILSNAPFSVLHLGIVLAFVVNMTWTSLALWNALIGFSLQFRRVGLSAVSPFFKSQRSDVALSERAAIVMTVRDEDPIEVFARLQTIKDHLDETASAH